MNAPLALDPPSPPLTCPFCSRKLELVGFVHDGTQREADRTDYFVCVPCQKQFSYSHRTGATKIL